MYFNHLMGQENREQRIQPLNLQFEPLQSNDEYSNFLVRQPVIDQDIFIDAANYS